jgi:hypothetical protein
MNRRLPFLEQDAEELRSSLVRHARADAAPPHAVRRTLRRVAVSLSGAIGIGATTATATAGKVSGLMVSTLVVKWAIVGATAGAVAIGIASRATRPHDAPPAPATVPAPQLEPAGRAPLSEGPPAVAPEEALEVGIPQPDTRGASGARGARRSTETEAIGEAAAPEVLPRPVPAPVLTPPANLARELALLEEARNAMVQGRPAAALGTLAVYDKEFAAGKMSSEATALRVEALVKAGLRDEGRAVARAFLAKYPRSPLVDRVRATAGL